MNVTRDMLDAASRYIGRRITDDTARAEVLEALSLTPHYGNDAPGRRDKGCRDVLRTPDDLLGVISVPESPGGRAVVR